LSVFFSLKNAQYFVVHISPAFNYFVSRFSRAA
jgi:hypothetical protein